MKKILTTLLIAFMLMNTTAFAAPGYGANGALELFVSNGAKDGDGSFEAPFGTIAEAKDYIRQVKANGAYPEKGVEVNLRGGKYPLNETLLFTEEDSGTEAGPVIYQGYANEEVKFYGGAEISMRDFKKVTDKTTLERLINDAARENIVYVDLNNYGITEYGNIMPIGYTSYAFYDFEGEQLVNRDKVSEWCGFVPRVSETLFYLDGEIKTLARYPNEGEFALIEEPISSGTPHESWNFVDNYTDKFINGSNGGPIANWEDVEGETIRVSSAMADRMKHWGDASDIWAYGYWKYHWADGSSSLKSYDAEKATFTLKWPNWSVKETTTTFSQKGDQFYMFNLLEELDIPGEWYLDRKDGKVYYWPEEGEEKGTVLITTMSDYAFQLKNASHIHFRKFTINGHRGRPFFSENSSNIKIELCNFYNIGYKAIEAYNSKEFKIISCYFENMQRGAAGITGTADDKLTPTNNLIENCWATKFALSKGNIAAFTLTGGVEDKMRHCRVNDNYAMGMSIKGYDNVAEYIEVYDILQMMADSGVSYDYQNYAVYGHKYRHCYIHDIVNNAGGAGLMGIYQDGGSCGVTVESCLFKNFDGKAIFFNGGRDNTARNNIFVDTYQGPVLTGIMAEGGEGYYGGTEEQKAVRYASLLNIKNSPKKDILYERYPGLANFYDDDPEQPKHNVIENSVTVNCDYGVQYQAFGSHPKEKAYADNIIEEDVKLTNDIFVNKTLGDFRVKEDSEVFEHFPDFEPIDFERVGIQTPQLAMRLGENSLSMLIGSNVAYKGFNSIYVDKDNRSVVPVIINDRTYLPIRFIGENLGGSVSFDDETRTATISLKGKKMSINSDTGEITVDDAIVEGFNAVNRENRLLVPVRALESMGETVMWYEGGLVVVGDAKDLNDTYNDGKENRGLIEELIRRLD